MKNTNEIKILLTGLGFGESPRWHDGRLWFANWKVEEVVAADMQGNSEVIVRMPSFPFSIDWLPDGRLLIISGREKLLQRMEADGTLTTHADLGHLTPDSCNEIVVDGRGSIYVNAGGFGPNAKGIIIHIAPDGTARQVADGIAFPNGMAITPDNSTLIIADSWGKKLTAFNIEADGSLSNGRTWASLGDGCPDGICIDTEGAVWYADVPNKRCVRVAEGGKILQTIHVDRGCFACMLGGPDRKTLFIVAAEWPGFEKMMDGPLTGQLLSVEVEVPGAGWPG